MDQEIEYVQDFRGCEDYKKESRHTKKNIQEQKGTERRQQATVEIEEKHKSKGSRIEFFYFIILDLRKWENMELEILMCG